LLFILFRSLCTHQAVNGKLIGIILIALPVLVGTKLDRTGQRLQKSQLFTALQTNAHKSSLSFLIGRTKDLLHTFRN